MKRKITLPSSVICICFLTLFACKSHKVPQAAVADNTQPTTAGICNSTIKYYSEKVVKNDGEEIKFNTEITVNPSDKTINITSEPPNQEKVQFNVVVENFECNFNATITEGAAIYKGYIIQKDGSSTKAYIKLEANNGVLTMSNADTERESNMTVSIARWEIIRG